MIYVVSHKKVEFIEKDGYSYILVNSVNNKELVNYFKYNDLGEDNISAKNYCYCELTALYKLWKKREKDGFIGIMHYRRFLSNRYNINSKYYIDKEEIKMLLKDKNFILPEKFYFKKSRYNVYFENGYGKKKDIDNLIEIVKKYYPDYYESLTKILNCKSGHYCNMFICKDDIFDDYCSWMFDVLGRLENITDITNYTQQEKRIYGFLSELLLDTFIEKNNYNYIEKKLVNTDEKYGLKFKLTKLKKVIRKILN